MFYNSKLNWALRITLALGLLAALYVAKLFPSDFTASFAAEDGPIEYATAILLFFAAGILATLAFKVTGYKRVLVGLYALLFFLAAGEEVSWGQRIFGIESSEFFTENNFQGETNFHNLVVGDTHLTDFVFGTGLALMIMCYLVVLPLLHPRVRWVQDFSQKLGVPVPQKHIGILAIVATLLCEWMDAARQWEVYEFAFSILICLVFLNPTNSDTFHIQKSDR